MYDQRRTKRKRIAILAVFGTALLILALIEFGSSYGDWQRETTLAASSAVTQGVVTNLYSISGRSRQYWVDYRYELGTSDDVLDFTGSQTVSQDFYNGLTTGKTVSIRYATHDPGVSEIDGQLTNFISPPCIGGLFTL